MSCSTCLLQRRNSSCTGKEAGPLWLESPSGSPASAVTRRQDLSSGCNALDFDERSFWKRLDRDCAPGGERLREEGSIYLIHGGEIPHVCEEDRRLDHVRKAEAGCLEYSRSVEKALPGLLPDPAFREGSGRRIYRKLASNEHKSAARIDCLAVRSDGRRGLVCLDRFHGSVIMCIRVHGRPGSGTWRNPGTASRRNLPLPLPASQRKDKSFL